MQSRPAISRLLGVTMCLLVAVLHGCGGSGAAPTGPATFAGVRDGLYALPASV